MRVCCMLPPVGAVRLMGLEGSSERTRVKLTVLPGEPVAEKFRVMLLPWQISDLWVKLITGGARKRTGVPAVASLQADWRFTSPEPSSSPATGQM